jgi:hypothetical protein
LTYMVPINSTSQALSSVWDAYSASATGKSAESLLTAGGLHTQCSTPGKPFYLSRFSASSKVYSLHWTHFSLVILGFELGASCLLSWHSITRVDCSAPVLISGT